MTARIIHHAVHFPGPPEAAFAMFTAPERLKTWLVPHAEVEPVLGGQYALFWDPEYRDQNSTLGCVITAIDPGRLLAFDWRGPTHLAAPMNTADPLTHVVVTFHPDGDGTRVHLLHTGWGSSAAWEEARSWFEGVWRNALAGLENQ